MLRLKARFSTLLRKSESSCSVANGVGFRGCPAELLWKVVAEQILPRQAKDRSRRIEKIIASRIMGGARWRGHFAQLDIWAFVAGAIIAAAQ